MGANSSHRSAGGGFSYQKLERRLLLLAWLNRQLGYGNNRDMLADLKEVREGFDSNGRSYIWHHWLARGDKAQIALEDLARYDDNIRGHLADINTRRSDLITLRYFQYLALLYTEILLDWRARCPGELLRTLNHFIGGRDEEFEESNLQKMAFWMATGSGKTLLMHFNYRQFLHYNQKPLDNILLITPNEGLSEQHEGEMIISGIPCRRFDLHETGLDIAGKNSVRVIEITKLVKEKRGGGVSVPVEAFEGNNLIFVDEGHKGSGGEAWREVREELGRTGFTFEYSATFGQALTASRNDPLTREYSKAIAFDYSYRYFYNDGYGKDFHILNLKKEISESQTDLLLMGNLLSFYEQQLAFTSQEDELRPYNLEKPLWVFVGSRVNAVYTDKGKKCSDVLTITRFLHRVLTNQGGWVTDAIDKLLGGGIGLLDQNEKDIFDQKFWHLRKLELDTNALYQDILTKVFHTKAGSGLHLCNLRGYPGEIGLQASGAEKYFGLIYIGDPGKFKNLIDADDSGLIWEDRAIGDSLFQGVNLPDSNIEILIGAKKFIEGWNSWRVSNMGLLNVGRSEGSEIIQLFGRGVRLRGKELLLKRSGALAGHRHPELIPLLETLNIFAVRANYMSQFHEYLEREGVETEYEDIPLYIRTNQSFLKKGLMMPKPPEGLDFNTETSILLDENAGMKVRVDMSLRVQTLESDDAGTIAKSAIRGTEKPIPEESFVFIDWEKAYIDLLEYKAQKGMHNLTIPFAALQDILATEPYDLSADDTVRKPCSLTDIELLNETARIILRKYVDKFYRNYKERWQSGRMVYQKVEKQDANLLFSTNEEMPHYKLKIPRSEMKLINEIKNLIEEGQAIYKKDLQHSIHFDRHLYQPLLVETSDNIKSDPPGLNEGERRFVEDLREYCSEYTAALKGAELFLLRNLGRGKGVSFFETRGFYPDFVLWIKGTNTQRIIFIEPHGMIYAETYQHDEKAQLHERLLLLTEEMRNRTGKKNITLDSFIVSTTEYKTLKERYGEGNWDRKQFTEKHILFPERTSDYDYIKIVLKSPTVIGQ